MADVEADKINHPKLTIKRFYNPSSRTMDMGSTQPLTEMSTRNLPGG
jgi:hypothetical protein